MPKDQTTDAEQIHERSKSCLAAMNRGDIDAVMDHYTDDAILLFSNVAPVRGSEAIRSHWESVADPNRSASLDTESITVVGDVAYEVGFYGVEEQGEGTGGGKNVVVWRKGDDGKWRLQVDICAADS